jgi:hypothetical protein
MLRVSRQWRHIHNLMFFGFGHDTDKEPGPGDMGLFCAACPQPDVNLPPDWQEDKEELVTPLQ